MLKKKVKQNTIITIRLISISMKVIIEVVNHFAKCECIVHNILPGFSSVHTYEFTWFWTRASVLLYLLRKNTPSYFVLLCASAFSWVHIIRSLELDYITPGELKDGMFLANDLSAVGAPGNTLTAHVLMASFSMLDRYGCVQLLGPGLQHSSHRGTWAPEFRGIYSAGQRCRPGGILHEFWASSHLRAHIRGQCSV